MERFIKAQDGYGNEVWLNSSQIVSIAVDKVAGKKAYVARVVGGENYTLKDDLFKGRILPYIPTIEDTGGSTKAMHIYPKKPVWISVNDSLPEEDKYVEVCTQEGQVYISQVLCGKFPTNVGWWKDLPELPEEAKKKAEMLKQINV